VTAPQGLTSADQGAGLSHPRPEILALTGLRGLAAVAVVLHQIGAPRSAPATLHHLIAAGGLGAHCSISCPASSWPTTTPR
jgi:peptidoglycan/LPS O-acetylase OafA/YrhL